MFLHPLAFFGVQKWPKGDDGPLLITTGNTVTLTAGTIKDYSSIQIDLGGSLVIDGSLSCTPVIIGCKGPAVINGVIRTNTAHNNGGLFSNTNPLGQTISCTIVQSLGGAGGDSNNGGFGGAGTNGYGGGGGGGVGGGGTGGNGGSGGSAGGAFSGSNAGSPGGGMVTLAQGASGGYIDLSTYSGSINTGGGGGGSGGGASGGNSFAQHGGGGGGGGMKGFHGVPLELYCKKSITGSGSINVGGTNGFSGGNGASSANGPSDNGISGGGSGGGGAGGSGGLLKIRYRTSFTVSYSVAAGAAGLGFIASGNTGNNGLNGVVGAAGSTDIAAL